MKRKSQKKPVKTDLTRYLTSEEGKIVKANVVKMAVALGIVGLAAQEVMAGHTSGHNNSLHNAGSGGGAYHSSGHASHASHGSHGSHGQW